ncbi:unnamed protein product [Cuscuta epithymum]|uniref:F-box domain-containing protein n=1 Tax=Cuscuta epithymum TaxID=186058 RepID=A0AAV0DJD6_9ASTE|nr:unnamed protein product [Cuscuta epithymum]
MLEHNKNCHHDIISNLPESLRETILTYLPLQDAVRTSVLSTKWRNTWTKISHLYFDETLWPGSSGGDKLELKSKCVRRILHTLLRHDGPINTLFLSISKLGIFPEVDNIMLILSKSDVEHLVLEFCSGKYILPSTFFKCQRLKHLSLCSCLFQPSSNFIGFSQLLTVEMIDVAMSSEQLESLINGCPLLEALTLKISPVCLTLDIQAPKLKYFEFISKLESVCFKNTPHLVEVVIVYDYDTRIIEWKETSLREESNLNELFKSLPALSNLRLGYTLPKFVSLIGLPERHSPTAVCLNTLVLEWICLERMGEMASVLFIVRMSPNLQDIIIHLYNIVGTADQKPSPKSLDVEENSDVKLNQLRSVQFSGFTGTRNQMVLAKLLLTKSPRLNKMVIKPNTKQCNAKRGFSILKELIRLPRPSAAAEIIFG